MSVNWNHALELEFLELYKSHPTVWDPNDCDHRDRNKVRDAWKAMSEIMNVPVKELKSKKDSLMATYRVHKRKIKASQQSGAGNEDIYSPIWFAFHEIDSFLGNIVQCNSDRTKSTLTDVQEIKVQDKNQHQQSPETNLEKIRKRKDLPDLKEAEKVVLQQDQGKNTCQEKEDECDLYGKILAKRLRKLPEHERINFMYEIDGMYIRRFSPTVSRPSSTVTSKSEPIPQ